MKNKTIYAFGIVVLLNLILSGVTFFKGDAPEVILGGTTNLDSLELSENLTVTGTTTLTGATTFTGGADIDSGLTVGSRYDYGHEASGAFSAASLCDYNLISIQPTTGSATSGDDEDRGASMSFPNDETMVASCIDTVGDSRSIYIDNTSSGSAYLDFDTTGIEMDLVSTSADFTGDMLIRVDVINIDGTSLSWRLESYLDQAGD